MIRLATLACVLLMGASGCLPDLVPGQHQAGPQPAPEPTIYSIEMEVKNIGVAPSTKALVYFNAIDASASSHHPFLQHIEELPPLPKGTSHTLHCEFELERLQTSPANAIEVLVDAKSYVKESNEKNNRAEWALPW